ncbi:MAG: tyrosine-type recombinase/integrase [Chloroflexota bacterium]
MKNETLHDTSLHLEQFHTDLLATEHSPVTVKGYVGDVGIFARWHEENLGPLTDIDQITSAAVSQYKEYLIGQQARASTINRRLSALAAYTNWAMDQGLMKAVRNPVQDVKSVQSDNPYRKWLNHGQHERLIQSIEELLAESKQHFPRLHHTRQRDATIVILLLNCGLRVRELIALKCSNVSLTAHGGHITVGKENHLRRRNIPLNERARQSLLDYLALRPEVDDEALFIGTHEEGIDEKTVQRAINRFASPAGLEQISPITCRHTFAKMLIDQGVSLEEVAVLLGNTRMTGTAKRAKESQ